MDLDISLPPALTARLVKHGFNTKRRMNFYGDLAAFVDAGIAPYQAMERMHDVGRPRRSMKWLVKLLSRVLKRMDNGSSLAQAMQPWVPSEEAAMLFAGERGGRLKDALIELTGLLKSRLDVAASLKSNLLPSAGMLAVLVLLMVYILNTVLKEARKLVSEEMFNKMTLAPLYFDLGEGFLKALPFILVLAVAIGIAVSASLPRWKPSKTRRWLDAHVPPYTLFSRVQASFFLITASSMMSAGSPFQQAVEDVQKSARPWLRGHTRRQLSKLSAGASEVDSMQTGMLPWDVEDRLAVYKMLDDFKTVMRVTARDSMQILLMKVQFIGGAIRITVMAALALFIIVTIFSIGEIALEAQSSINTVQPNN